MVTCENIVNAYRAREKSENWAVWAQKNRDAARVLEAALRATQEGE